MKKFLIAIMLVFATLSAEAAIRPFYQPIKLPNQSVLEKVSFGTPVAASTSRVLSADAGNTSTAAASVTSFDAQPDVARNIVITPGGSTGDVAECTVTVSGTNIKGEAISETFAFAADASTATTGAKAFKTVTSVAFPANCEETPFDATWDVGVGEKIGLRHCMAAAGDWGWSHVGGTFESTRATMAVDADEVEKNTADFNGTMNGSSEFVGYYIQNFRCVP